MSKVHKIYDVLLKEFGPQGWWPVTEKGKIAPEYSNGPKNETQQLEVIFGTILAQNTSWKNAEKAIINLNRHKLVDAKKILEIPDKELALIIRSSGYHNQKARKLKNFCNFLKKYGYSLKNLFSLKLADLREELLSINGIGPETANSIILYSAAKPLFVVDAYAKRIFSRIGFKEGTYDGLQDLFMNNLQKDASIFNEYHALIVQHAKVYCKKIPACSSCPLRNGCASSPKGQASLRGF